MVDTYKDSMNPSPFDMDQETAVYSVANTLKAVSISTNTFRMPRGKLKKIIMSRNSLLKFLCSTRTVYRSIAIMIRTEMVLWLTEYMRIPLFRKELR
jgi:hypothetical protein